MDSYRVDDELCPFDGPSPIPLRGSGALGDDIVFVHLPLLVTDGAIVGGAGDCLDEAATRRVLTFRPESPAQFSTGADTVRRRSAQPDSSLAKLTQT
jgi:hypothetical protein